LTQHSGERHHRHHQANMAVMKILLTEEDTFEVRQ
jgi:hypothetical protein